MIAHCRIELLQRHIARFDDQPAYKELFTAFYPGLYNYTNGLLKCPQVTEEIISDVFIKIWEKRKELERIVNLKVYCYVSAKHLAINYILKKKHHANIDIGEFAGNLPSFNLDPEQLMITAELLQRIRKAVDSLPPQCKMIFILVKENGFKHREAAEIMHLSVKTIENQLTIAVKKIGAAIGFKHSGPSHDQERPLNMPAVH